ncbi:unnamed protein product [Linum tenue]|uniref:Uncharacterized protein n=1 Tax=Linum tenue TaxID=586396 RepID=A0AAV0PZV6_9ROSI|nr:unnamed protein product [Linum tenue]
MIEAEAEKVSQGEEPSIFAIYQEVIGSQCPKRVLGINGYHGVSSVDVFGPPSSQGCNKRCQEERTKEREKNYEKIKKLENEILDVRNAVPHIVESMLQRPEAWSAVARVIRYQQ